MDRKDITDQIYDTLMGNADVWPSHEPFDPDDIEECNVSAESGTITFTLKTGEKYLIQVTRMGLGNLK